MLLLGASARLWTLWFLNLESILQRFSVIPMGNAQYEWDAESRIERCTSTKVVVNHAALVGHSHMLKVSKLGKYVLCRNLTVRILQTWKWVLNHFLGKSKVPHSEGHGTCEYWKPARTCECSTSACYATCVTKLWQSSGFWISVCPTDLGSANNVCKATTQKNVLDVLVWSVHDFFCMLLTVKTLKTAFTCTWHARKLSGIFNYGDLIHFFWLSHELLCASRIASSHAVWTRHFRHWFVLYL